MTLSIKNPRADELARELAALTGESITEAVVVALESRLELERRRTGARDLDNLVDRFAKLPTLDSRDIGEILGYNDDGVNP